MYMQNHLTQMGGPVNTDSANETSGRMMRKFTQGPFKDLAFRRYTVPGDPNHFDLLFWNGRKIRVTLEDYQAWAEKDCVTNR